MNQPDFMSDLDSIDTAIGIDTNSIKDKGGDDHSSIMTSLGYQYAGPKVVPRDMPKDKIKLNPITTFSIKYHLTAEQLEDIEKEVPYRRFRYEPKEEHDHPLTNIYNTVNEAVVIESYKGQPFVDLHGRANRNAAMKANARVYRGKFTTRDYLRASTEEGKSQDYISTEWVISQNKGVKYWMVNHAAYYMSIDEIGSIVYSTAGAELTAIVHRHDRLRGTINGEYDYVIDEDGFVHQTSKLGETYKHPTMEPFFHQYEAVTSSGVIAWTADKMAGDTYKLRFVACPGYPSYKVDKFETPSYGIKPDPKITFQTEDYQVKSVFGYQWLTFNEYKEVALDNIGLFDELSRFIANKERNESTFKDLGLYCRRLIDKNDLFAKHGGKHYEIPTEHIVWYVCAAFYKGISNENCAMLHFRRNYRKEVELHQDLKTSIRKRDTTIRDRVADAADAAVTASTQTLKFMGNVANRTGATLAKDIALDSFHKFPTVAAANKLMEIMTTQLKEEMGVKSDKDPRLLMKIIT